MSRTPRLLIAFTAALVLSACVRGQTKPDVPGASAVVKPTIVTVYVDRYVRIDPELTRILPIPEGSLSQCPDVGAARKAAMINYAARMQQISQIQGTPVKPEAKP
jgi:hypothetical protein